jgi:adenosine deaminase
VLTISSDDPPLMRTTLTDEFRRVVLLAGLTRDDLAELQRGAARAAFADAATNAAVNDAPAGPTSSSGPDDARLVS